mmetsp:Transcript_105710/g.340965  ORF Transcript_105710/g.340965 Transcript_105710/m.340965 type:complete len:402 (+) Transcript_105710:67-1272(+)
MAAGATACSLRASGLPPEVDEHDLRALFAREDRLVGVRVACDVSGACCGYATLEFETGEAAARAFKRYDNRQLPGHRARLRLAMVACRAGALALTAYQLCVGNLDGSVADADLFDAFRSVSVSVAGARVPTDPATRRAYGYGFVRFKTDEDALEAMPRAQGMLVAGKPLFVCQTYSHEIGTGGRARAAAPDGSSTCIFVGNLGTAVTEDWLRLALGSFGRVHAVRVVPAHGFGFASFAEHAAALAALSLMQDRELYGRRLRLTWASRQSLCGPPQEAPRCRGPGMRRPRDESPDRDDWHASMQPVARRPADSLGPQGAPLDAADTVYWLSFFVGAGATGPEPVTARSTGLPVVEAATCADGGAAAGAGSAGEPPLKRCRLQASQGAETPSPASVGGAGAAA